VINSFSFVFFLILFTRHHDSLPVPTRLNCARFETLVLLLKCSGESEVDISTEFVVGRLQALSRRSATWRRFTARRLEIESPKKVLTIRLTVNRKMFAYRVRTFFAGRFFISHVIILLITYTTFYPLPLPKISSNSERDWHYDHKPLDSPAVHSETNRAQLFNRVTFTHVRKWDDACAVRHLEDAQDLTDRDTRNRATLASNSNYRLPARHPHQDRLSNGSNSSPAQSPARRVPLPQHRHPPNSSYAHHSHVDPLTRASPTVAFETDEPVDDDEVVSGNEHSDAASRTSASLPTVPAVTAALPVKAAAAPAQSLAALAASLTANQRTRRQSQPTGYLRRRSLAAGGRLSVADLAGVSGAGGGGLLRRRRAVEISDHKAVVLLHSKLKGMKLEDIA
jgi:hypothetical protein